MKLSLKKNTLLFTTVALSYLLLMPSVYAQDDSAVQSPNLLPDVSIDAPLDNSSLSSPSVQESSDVRPSEGSAASPAQSPGRNLLVEEQRVPQLPEDDTIFYDAEALVPEGELARQAPRRVDPRVEPASKLVIVRQAAPSNSDQAKLVAASRALTLGRYSSALEIYNEMYARNSRDPNVLMGRAVALQKLGLLEEAVTAYERVLEANPRNVEARTNMLGLIAERYPAVALQQLRDLRQESPDSAGIVAQIAIAEAKLGNYDSAIRYMGVAASLEPKNANHYFNMAIMADRAGAVREAVKYYEMSLETDSIYGGGRSIPRDTVYTRLAQLR
ncbi:MAG: tetratricopeptide repeat protein [Alphaproteobacteria bacterium]